MIIDKPKKTPYFVLLPELTSTIVSLIFYYNLKDDSIAILNLAAHIILFFASVFYYIKSKDKISIYTLSFILLSYIICFSIGCYLLFMHKQLYLSSILSFLFIISMLSSLIYLSYAIIINSWEFRGIKLTLSKLILFVYITGIAICFINNSFESLIIIILIGLTTIFVFLLVMACYFIYKNTINSNEQKLKKRGFKFFLCLLPLVCLFLNNVVFNNLFGDFSNKWFYILAVSNALLYLIDIDKTNFKLLIYFFKSIGFIYVTYFACIFLMYLAVGVIGIVYFGLGLLVFTPYVLFIIQFKQMVIDFKQISLFHTKKQIFATMLVGFLAIPTIVLANYNLDRINYENAMTYINPNKTQKTVNINRLQSTIKKIDNTIKVNRSLYSYKIPVLSYLYSNIVVKNLRLDKHTNYKLKKIFNPEGSYYLELSTQNNQSINENTIINSFTVNAYLSDTEFDSSTGIYKSWVNLDIQSTNGDAEFITTFDLPTGCFITDYYLYVGDEKKHGLITDKRAANVTYNRIVNTRKDPGIISYIADNVIELKIFPFEKNQLRKSGFQVMYTKDEQLIINNKTIKLKTNNISNKPIVFDNVEFIPNDYKKNLPKYNRTPEFYFLIDISNEKTSSDNIKLTEQYVQKFNIKNPKYYVVTYDAKEIKDFTKLLPLKPLGGFNYPLAMEKAINNIDSTKIFPIFILISDNMDEGLNIPVPNVSYRFPETNYCYVLKQNLMLCPYDLSTFKSDYSVNHPFIEDAYNYNGFAISLDSSNEIIYKNTNINTYSDNIFENALLLNKKAYLSFDGRDVINSTKDSINFRILNKNTSFIVLETKEQEEELLRLQKKYLSGELSDTIPVMSESNLFVVLFMICIIMYLKNRKTV